MIEPPALGLHDPLRQAARPSITPEFLLPMRSRQRTDHHSKVAQKALTTIGTP
jgi:hypothetical protein